MTTAAFIIGFISGLVIGRCYPSFCNIRNWFK